MTELNPALGEAMRLMRSGDLKAATRAIQEGLRGGSPSPSSAFTPKGGAASRDLDGEFRRVHDVDDTFASPDEGRDSSRANDSSRTSGGSSSAAPDTAFAFRDSTPVGSFTEHAFTSRSGTLRYKLFVPARVATAKPPPLLVMLHGCTQSPDDFARGTRMNALAQARGWVVAWPWQPQSRNSNKCWNWFEADPRCDGPGESGLIAALAGHLVREHGLDEQRIFAAGLSAGGAMAVALARAHPGLFAAIGVHSGLPAGVASDVASAFAAMKQGHGHRATAAQPPRMHPVPVIVFHGDRDTTVHPRNGDAVVAQCIDADSPFGRHPDAQGTTEERGTVPGGRTYTRTKFTKVDGRVLAERWIVHGGGHAWFGGDAAGSHSDPAGPDASAQMLRFFDECTRAPD